ncbi:hypothetical protein UPYG_G00238070 [Umbra pygmaea]|uniref:Uncharacterized protein n=1 Tax=Umbra pygmaea TaxID=75934 RepID=A0ABD0WGA5_UMBPY
MCGLPQKIGVLQIKFQEPPEPTVVPSCTWLLTVYSQDILTRLDEIHARITSTYSSVLKMNSTKKITKKLAGAARGTRLWLTSVGNEFGQVLISVLTAQEGAGLDMMVDGMGKRYQQANVDPPGFFCTWTVAAALMWVRPDSEVGLISRFQLGHLAFYAQDCHGVYN